MLYKSSFNTFEIETYITKLDTWKQSITVN